MLSKKFWGIFASAVMTLSMLSFGNSFVYAGEEVHKHSEKALAPEHVIVVEEEFICPSCKEVRTSPEKGRTLALMTMVCPDCKNEIGEFSVHHCDKCGTDVLVCPKCKAAAAELKAATMEGKCPKC